MRKKDDSQQFELPKDHKDYGYDEWLEFFRTKSASELITNEDFLMRNISTEGYAALKRWLEIIDSPSKMDKLYQGRIKAQHDRDIMELAVGDDDEAFYEALIKENVEQLNSGNVSPQEVARLSQNTNIFRKELREIRSRKPKENTKLAKVLKALDSANKKGSKEQSESPKPKKVAKPQKNSTTSKKQGPKTRSKASKPKKTVSKSTGGKNG